MRHNQAWRALATLYSRLDSILSYFWQKTIHHVRVRVRVCVSVEKRFKIYVLTTKKKKEKKK